MYPYLMFHNIHPPPPISGFPASAQHPTNVASSYTHHIVGVGNLFLGRFGQLGWFHVYQWFDMARLPLERTEFRVVRVTIDVHTGDHEQESCA